MKIITAEELSKVMSEIAEQSDSWVDFVDNVAFRMYDLGYATNEILDPEYMGRDYEYIFAQANNFWKTFKRGEF